MKRIGIHAAFIVSIVACLALAASAGSVWNYNLTLAGATSVRTPEAVPGSTSVVVMCKDAAFHYTWGNATVTTSTTTGTWWPAGKPLYEKSSARSPYLAIVAADGAATSACSVAYWE